jgi:hypothetical protein
LRINTIVAWAEAHHERTGHWPTKTSGPIVEAPGETWSGVNTALRNGLRELTGGQSLARLLARKRGVRNRNRLPLLTVDEVLLWADRYHQETGRWPTQTSGPIPGTIGESWRTVEKVLRKGGRGLPGGSSLARLLSEHRGKRNRKVPPRLTPEEVRSWALAHRQATGYWPTKNSGLITAAPGETWTAVDCALRGGRRGLPGGSSLARFLAQEPPSDSPGVFRVEPQ